MSEHTTEQHMIYSTYSSVLLTLIHNIMTEYSKGNYTKAWNTMQMLYEWLPTKCKTEVKEDYPKVLAEMNTITSRDDLDNVWHSDIHTRRIMISKDLRNCAFRNLLRLSGIIQASLEKHRYLGK